MPVQGQIMFYQGTQCADWINNGGLTYKNTTHQNIIMHYLECIFLNCTVMPLNLPLTFRCLSKCQFPFIWWWKIDVLMASCIIHLSFYWLKKTVGILINYRFDCNNSHVFLCVHNHQTWTQNVTSNSSS